MRRYFVLSVLGVCLLVFASGASAVAGGTTYYAGKNAQGLKLFFSADHTASGPKFDPFFINQVSRCPATGNAIRVEFSFQGFQVPVNNGKFNLVLNGLGDRFGWSGTVTSKGASGKEHIDFAAFDSKGGLQDCGAGSLSWTANALVPASTTVTPSATYMVKAAKASSGAVSYSITQK